MLIDIDPPILKVIFRSIILGPALIDISIVLN